MGFFKQAGGFLKKAAPIVLPVAAIGLAASGVPIPGPMGGLFTGETSQSPQSPPGTVVVTQAAPPIQAGIFGVTSPVALLVLFAVLGFVGLAFFSRRGGS